MKFPIYLLFLLTLFVNVVNAKNENSLIIAHNSSVNPWHNGEYGGLYVNSNETPTETPLPPTPMKTPTPTRTPPHVFTSGPTRTPVPVWQQIMIITDNADSTVDLSNAVDNDSKFNRGLAIHWDWTQTHNIVLNDISDVHIQISVDGDEYVYLGRTASATASSLSWIPGSQLIHPDFREGPQYGHTYEFRVSAISESGTVNAYGPFYSAGPVEFKSFMTVETKYNYGMAIQWDLAQADNIDLDDIKDIHVQVSVDGDEFVYLGRTESGTSQLLPWIPNSQLIHPDFREGPQFGYTYDFRLLAITESGIPEAYGPFYSAGPVELRSSITVEDDLNATKDLSNDQDYDSKWNRQLVISWDFDPETTIRPIKLADFHVYVSVNGGTYTFFGRAHTGFANHLNWNGGDLRFHGPFENAGPAEFLPLVTVTDNILALNDVSNGLDQDAPDSRQLVIRYNFEGHVDFDLETIADFYVYVKVDSRGWTFLGRNNSAMAPEFIWDNKMIPKLSNPDFHSGPQFGHSYLFRVYPVTVSGIPKFYGPFESAGPVEFVSTQ